MFELNKLFHNQPINEFLPQENQVREWQLLSKSYAPPRREISGLEVLSKEIQEKALFGVTIFLWEDRLTGDLRKEEILGSDETQLSELFMKVKQFGPQHIKDANGEVYTMSKYIAPVVDPLSLPMR